MMNFCEIDGKVVDAKVDYSKFGNRYYIKQLIGEIIVDYNYSDRTSTPIECRRVVYKSSDWIEVDETSFIGYVGNISFTPNGKRYKRAILDFSHINRNETVASQGVVRCIWIDAYGFGAWFSPELGRYPSRQDLATITELSSIEI